MHGRGGAAAARRHADHGRAAIGRARAVGQGQLHLGGAERLLRRLRAVADPRRRAGRPLRSATAGADRSGAVRARGARRGARAELRRADRRPRDPRCRRRSGQPGGACRCRVGVSGRAPRRRAGDLGRKRRDVEPDRSAAGRSADGRLRLARGLVGARAADDRGRGRGRAAGPARAPRPVGVPGRIRPIRQPDRRGGDGDRGADVRRDDRRFLHRGAVPAAGRRLLGARRRRGPGAGRAAGRRRRAAGRQAGR